MSVDDRIDTDVPVEMVIDVIQRTRVVMGQGVDLRLRTDGIVQPKGHRTWRNYALWMIDWSYNSFCRCDKCVGITKRIDLWWVMWSAWPEAMQLWQLHVCPANEFQERYNQANAKGDTWLWNQRTHRWEYVKG